MDVFKMYKTGSELIIVAGEVCGELTYLYVLRLSRERSIAAKRDRLLYAYRTLAPEKARVVAELLEKLSPLSEGDIRSLVSTLLSKGAEWGRRDMPVYRFRGAVVEVSPSRRPRRLFIKTDSPAVAEALRKELRARWLPHLRGWLVEAYDWRSAVEKVRVLVEAEKEKDQRA